MDGTLEAAAYLRGRVCIPAGMAEDDNSSEEGEDRLAEDDSLQCFEGHGGQATAAVRQSHSSTNCPRSCAHSFYDIPFDCPLFSPLFRIKLVLAEASAVVAVGVRLRLHQASVTLASMEVQGGRVLWQSIYNRFYATLVVIQS